MTPRMACGRVQNDPQRVPGGVQNDPFKARLDSLRIGPKWLISLFMPKAWAIDPGKVTKMVKSGQIVSKTRSGGSGEVKKRGLGVATPEWGPKVTQNGPKKVLKNPL